MFRLIGIVVVCLLVFAGAAYYFNWFSVSISNTEGARPDVHLTIDKTKAEEDAKAVKDKVHNWFDEKKVEGAIQQIEIAPQELTILNGKKQDVMIKVDATAKIKIGDAEGSFSDLKLNDTVSVMYDAKKDGNVARTITVSKKS